MKIFVTGTRGIPDIPGGVEKHCQELYPRIAARGHEVIIATRSPYVKTERHEWSGIKLVNCFAPRQKHLEAIVHTFLALLRAKQCCPDLVHIHAIGPALLTPLARLMGFPVVLTSQGPDYDRGKWGWMAKFVLRLGEKIGGVLANEVIVVSSVIAAIVHDRCHREPHIIHNGVTMPKPAKAFDFLNLIGVRPGKYILAVARFVPEKGLHDLIDAFKAIETDFRLVIAGDADHESDYSKELKRKAKMDNRVILTGYIAGESLNQVYTHASLFVLPSYHEGLPLALLEALSYGLPVLVSDIPANEEVLLPSERFFRVGDVRDLAEKIRRLLGENPPGAEREMIRQTLAKHYNWDKIADQTIDVYYRALNHLKPKCSNSNST